MFLGLIYIDLRVSNFFQLLGFPLSTYDLGCVNIWLSRDSLLDLIIIWSEFIPFG